MQVKGTDGVSGSGKLDHNWKRSGTNSRGQTRNVSVKAGYTPAQTQTIMNNWHKVAQSGKSSSSSSGRRRSAGGSASASAAASAAAVATPAASSGGEYYGGGSSSSDNGWSEYLAYMQQLREQAQRAAEEAYQRTVNNINNSYGQAANNMKSNYDSALANLKSVLGTNQGNINRDSENSMQQAYINNMMSRRNLQQNLTAQGLSGGAAESTMASLANNYGTARNQIDTTRNDNLQKLLKQYQNDTTQAGQNYNDAVNNLNLQKMSALNNAETALNNQTVSNFTAFTPEAPDYTSLVTALAGTSYTPTAANNTYNPVNLQQASGANGTAGTTSTNYGKYLQQAQLQAATGSSATSIKNSLMQAYNQGAINLYDLTSIANQLGISI